MKLLVTALSVFVIAAVSCTSKRYTIKISLKGNITYNNQMVRVQFNGQEVGSVYDMVKLDSVTTILDLSIKKGVQIPRSAKATFNENILGDFVVSISSNDSKSSAQSGYLMPMDTLIGTINVPTTITDSTKQKVILNKLKDLKSNFDSLGTSQ